MNFYNLNRSKVYNIYPIHIRSYSKSLYDLLEEKQTSFGRELSSNVEKSNILMNMCMSDMVEYSTSYLIIVNKKWNHISKKRLFSKIKQKMQKNETVRLSKVYRNIPKKI